MICYLRLWWIFFCIETDPHNSKGSWGHYPQLRFSAWLPGHGMGCVNFTFCWKEKKN